eukprot:5424631-Alexandrium_andersonii.AAC.1
MAEGNADAMHPECHMRNGGAIMKQDAECRMLVQNGMRVVSAMLLVECMVRAARPGKQANRCPPHLGT